jgi:hypothetical protein
MLTLTSLKNPSYLARVKAAVLRAVEKSHKGSPDRLGYADVYNRQGAASLEVVAQRGGPVTIWTEAGQDVTRMVMGALREYHSQPAPLPLIQIDFDSGPFRGISPCA